MPVVTFAAVTAVALLVLAWVYVNAAVVLAHDTGYMFASDDSRDAARPIVALWLLYLFWEMGLSIDGVVRGLEVIVGVIP